MAKKQQVRVTDLFGNVVLQKGDLAISRERLTSALEECFKDVTLEEFVAFMTNPFMEITEYARLCRGARTCMKTSLLYNPHRLAVTCKGRADDSVMSCLHKKNWISGLARACLSQCIRGIAPYSLLYRTISMGVNNAQIALEFPPYVARDLCRMFGVPVRGRVLDPCAGWGGRMLGVSSVGAHYWAFEPATRTHAGLLKLYRFIRHLNPEFEARVVCLPYEDAKLPEDHFDFALTSPPYYDTERYANEETNSWVRYHSFEEWCDGFYRPFVLNTMRALRPGATFVINIGDRQYPLSDTLKKICGTRYSIRLLPRFLSAQGLGKTRDLGEKFYAIRKGR